MGGALPLIARRPGRDAPDWQHKERAVAGEAVAWSIRSAVVPQRRSPGGAFVGYWRGIGLLPAMKPFRDVGFIECFEFDHGRSGWDIDPVCVKGPRCNEHNNGPVLLGLVPLKLHDLMQVPAPAGLGPPEKFVEAVENHDQAGVAAQFGQSLPGINLSRW